MKKAVSGEINAFLDADTSVTGEMVVPGAVRIDGKLKGKVVAGVEVVIGETADVDAEIVSPTVSISGKTAGIIRASKLIEVFQGAHVMSNLVTPSLRIDDGARLEGRCEVVPGAGPEPGQAK